MKHYEDFINEAQQYDDILKSYEVNGNVFTDPNFELTTQIKGLNKEYDEEKYELKRIDEIYSVPLFKIEGIKEDAIQKGDLEDDYFIASLLRITKQPNLVKILFDTRTNVNDQNNTINLKCGAAIVYFHVFGKRTPVLIDTLLPFNKETGIPLFSRPSDIIYSPWFCLVEKAYAKLHGSYSSIIKGSISQAIYHLFGYLPYIKNIDTILQKKHKTNVNQDTEVASNSDNKDNLDNNEYIFSLLMKWQYENAVLGIETNDENSQAFLIAKARREEEKNFICLKNTCNANIWPNNFSNNASSSFTSELKRKLGVHRKNNGTFWMSDSDFTNYFTSIDVCKPINPDHHVKIFVARCENDDSSKPKSYAFKLQDFSANKQAVNDAKVRICVEKRSSDDEENTQYQILLVNSNGKKVEINDVQDYKHKSIEASGNFFTFTTHVQENEPFVILFQRKDKNDVIDEYYVTVCCKYNFDLYDVDSPDSLAEEEEKVGIVLSNESKRYRNIAKKVVVRSINGKDIPAYEASNEDEINESFYKHLSLNQDSECSTMFFEYDYDFNDDFYLSVDEVQEQSQEKEESCTSNKITDDKSVDQENQGEPDLDEGKTEENQKIDDQVNANQEIQNESTLNDQDSDATYSIQINPDEASMNQSIEDNNSDQEAQSENNQNNEETNLDQTATNEPNLNDHPDEEKNPVQLKQDEQNLDDQMKEDNNENLEAQNENNINNQINEEKNSDQLKTNDQLNEENNVEQELHNEPVSDDQNKEEINSDQQHKDESNSNDMDEIKKDIYSLIAKEMSSFSNLFKDDINDQRLDVDEFQESFEKINQISNDSNLSLAEKISPFFSSVRSLVLTCLTQSKDDTDKQKTKTVEQEEDDFMQKLNEALGVDSSDKILDSISSLKSENESLQSLLNEKDQLIQQQLQEINKLSQKEENNKIETREIILSENEKMSSSPQEQNEEHSSENSPPKEESQQQPVLARKVVYVSNKKLALPEDADETSQEETQSPQPIKEEKEEEDMHKSDEKPEEINDYEVEEPTQRKSIQEEEPSQTNEEKVQKSSEQQKESSTNSVEEPNQKIEIEEEKPIKTNDEDVKKANDQPKEKVENKVNDENQKKTNDKETNQKTAIKEEKPVQANEEKTEQNEFNIISKDLRIPIPKDKEIEKPVELDQDKKESSSPKEKENPVQETNAKKEEEDKAKPASKKALENIENQKLLNRKEKWPFEEPLEHFAPVFFKATHNQQGRKKNSPKTSPNNELSNPNRTSNDDNTILNSSSINTSCSEITDKIDRLTPKSNFYLSVFDGLEQLEEMEKEEVKKDMVPVTPLLRNSSGSPILQKDDQQLEGFQEELSSPKVWKVTPSNNPQRPYVLSQEDRKAQHSKSSSSENPNRLSPSTPEKKVDSQSDSLKNKLVLSPRDVFESVGNQPQPLKKNSKENSKSQSSQTPEKQEEAPLVPKPVKKDEKKTVNPSSKPQRAVKEVIDTNEKKIVKSNKVVKENVNKEKKDKEVIDTKTKKENNAKVIKEKEEIKVKPKEVVEKNENKEKQEVKKYKQPIVKTENKVKEENKKKNENKDKNKEIKKKIEDKRKTKKKEEEYDKDNRKNQEQNKNHHQIQQNIQEDDINNITKTNDTAPLTITTSPIKRARINNININDRLNNNNHILNANNNNDKNCLNNDRLNNNNHIINTNNNNNNINGLNNDRNNVNTNNNKKTKNLNNQMKSNRAGGNPYYYNNDDDEKMYAINKRKRRIYDENDNEINDNFIPSYRKKQRIKPVNRKKPYFNEYDSDLELSSTTNDNSENKLVYENEYFNFRIGGNESRITNANFLNKQPNHLNYPNFLPRKATFMKAFNLQKEQINCAYLPKRIPKY